MTTTRREKVIGDSVDWIDGPLKVTGAALYPSDFTFPDLTHAVLVQSTIAAGTITGIDAAQAEAALGDPVTVAGTAFKVELAPRTIVRIVQEVSGVQS